VVSVPSSGRDRLELSAMPRTIQEYSVSVPSSGRDRLEPLAIFNAAGVIFAMHQRFR